MGKMDRFFNAQTSKEAYLVNPFFTASIASVVYFIIFITLKYFLQNRVLDLQGALTGAVVFGIVIFLIHKFLNRRYG